jgi:putative endonuclease
MHYLYILQCRDNSLYTGTSHDPDRRLQEHQSGADPDAYTFNRLPVRRIYLEAFESENDALAAVRKIKKWSRAKKLAYVAGDWEAVSRLAKKDFEK